MTIFIRIALFDETELRAFLLSSLLSLPLFFSPSTKKRHKKHRIKRERAVMETKKGTEFRFIALFIMFIYEEQSKVWERSIYRVIL